MKFNIFKLFEAVKHSPKLPMNQAGRLMGKHCKARLLRAQAKRRTIRGHVAYTP